MFPDQLLQHMNNRNLDWGHNLLRKAHSERIHVAGAFYYWQQRKDSFRFDVINIKVPYDSCAMKWPV